MSRVEEVGKRLDELGITLINFRDPVDGSEVPAIDWQQIEILLNKLQPESVRATYIPDPKYRRNGW